MKKPYLTPTSFHIALHLEGALLDVSGHNVGPNVDPTKDTGESWSQEHNPNNASIWDDEGR